MPPPGAGSASSASVPSMASELAPLPRKALVRARAVLGVGFPPVRRRAFWAVQGLVFVIAGVHTFVEVGLRVEFPPPLYLVPTSLFFVPVIYAALRFGMRGSVITALWSIALTLPNIVLLHHGYDRIGILWQLGAMLAIAAVVGARVDLEREAHDETTARERELRASEEQYRSLFDNAAEAVLVIDTAGVVQDANAAAQLMLGRPVADLVGLPLAEASSPEIAAAVRPGEAHHVAVLLPAAGDRQDRWVDPVTSRVLPGRRGGPKIQIMLHDMTLQHERQAGLERYARNTVAAREEERRRIGRDLHDGPLQALMLAGRKLDAIDDRPPADAGASPVLEARQLIDDTAAEVRRISRALRPSILDDLGLVPALRSEADALRRRTDITVQFASPPAVSATPEVELLLLRVVQEALHNVEKHAEARLVAVRLSVAGTCVRLVVRDDGKGPGRLPSAATLLAEGHQGVVGMEERARLVGGEFTLRPARPAGTVVSVWVPAT
jgi:signal transduction histidine kinase